MSLKENLNYIAERTCHEHKKFECYQCLSAALSAKEAELERERASWSQAYDRTRDVEKELASVKEQLAMASRRQAERVRVGPGQAGHGG